MSPMLNCLVQTFSKQLLEGCNRVSVLLPAAAAATAQQHRCSTGATTQVSTAVYANNSWCMQGFRQAQQAHNGQGSHRAGYLQANLQQQSSWARAVQHVQSSFIQHHCSILLAAYTSAAAKQQAAWWHNEGSINWTSNDSKQQGHKDPAADPPRVTWPETETKRQPEIPEEDQELLRRWRVESAEWFNSSAMEYIAQSYLAMPGMSPWSFLYHKPRGWLAQVLQPKGSTGMTPLLRWEYSKPRKAAVPLLQMAHTDFQLPEFIEGVKHAVSTVIGLYALAGWQALRPMVSSGLLESMQQARKAQDTAAEGQNIKLLSASLDVHTVDIVCVHAISAEQLKEFDEQRAQHVSGVGGTSYWDVAHVYVEATLHAELLQQHDVDRTVSTPKAGHWVLCRGPLQVDKIVPADADLPWFVLTWL